MKQLTTIKLIVVLFIGVIGATNAQDKIVEHAQDQISNKKASSVVQDYLLTVQEEVNKIINPKTQEPIQITDFENIYKAAGKLDSTRYPSDYIFVMNSLLGRAASVGNFAPDASYPLTFPQDHHIHPNMGREWYYVAGHMQVTDEDGNSGSDVNIKSSCCRS